MRRPQPLERIRDGGEVAGVLDRDACFRLDHAHTWAFDSIASRMRAIASATGIPFSWVPARKRKLTAPAARSSSPAMSWNGTFALVWVRIFLGIRSLEWSTSARTPAAFSWSMTPSRYGPYSSATGMPTTWTGDSHTGNAPA